METLKIVKIGGGSIDDPLKMKAFVAEFSKLSGPKILVHGGGKTATQLSEKLNIPVQMVGGRRATNRDTLDVITMVYAGKINKTIIAQLQAFGCNAIGFTGADGNIIISEKREVTQIDYGLVGDVLKVNTVVLDLILTVQITPVLCAITHDANGQLLNTNADTIAAEIAVAFAAKRPTELLYCVEQRGVMTNLENESSLIPIINEPRYVDLLHKKIITEGMLPKMENSFYALQNKVKQVRIGKAEELFRNTKNYTTLVL